MYVDEQLQTRRVHPCKPLHARGRKAIDLDRVYTDKFLNETNCHLRFYQELEITLKPREMVIFCVLLEKEHINKHCAWFKPQNLLLFLLS